MISQLLRDWKKGDTLPLAMAAPDASQSKRPGVGCRQRKRCQGQKAKSKNEKKKGEKTKRMEEETIVQGRKQGG